MKKTLKQFRVAETKPELHCHFCEKMFDSEKISSVRITTRDANNHYTNSKLRMIHNYSIKLCPACFKKFQVKLNELIYDIS